MKRIIKKKKSLLNISDNIPLISTEEDLLKLKKGDSFKFVCVGNHDTDRVHVIKDFRPHRIERYKTFLCQDCMTEKTNLELYGKPKMFLFGSKEFLDNMVEKHGGTATMNCPDLKKAVQKTNLKLYKSISPFGNKEVRAKSELKNTILHGKPTWMTYGSDEWNNMMEIKHGDKKYRNRKQAEITAKTKNNGEYIGWSEESRLKRNETIKNRSSEETDRIYKSIRDKCMELYGVPYYSQSLEYHLRKKSNFFYGCEKFDSNPEICVWIFCVDFNIPIVRTPCLFEYDYDGKLHIYVPDFIIGNTFVEIKGSNSFKSDGTMKCPFKNHPKYSDEYMDAWYEAKHQCGLKNGVVFMTEKDEFVKNCIKYVKQAYASNFTSWFRYPSFIQRPIIQGNGLTYVQCDPVGYTPFDKIKPAEDCKILYIQQHGVGVTPFEINC